MGSAADNVGNGDTISGAEPRFSAPDGENATASTVPALVQRWRTMSPVQSYLPDQAAMEQAA